MLSRWRPLRRLCPCDTHTAPVAGLPTNDSGRARRLDCIGARGRATAYIFSRAERCVDACVRVCAGRAPRPAPGPCGGRVPAGSAAIASTGDHQHGSRTPSAPRPPGCGPHRDWRGPRPAVGSVPAVAMLLTVKGCKQADGAAGSHPAVALLTRPAGALCGSTQHSSAIASVTAASVQGEESNACGQCPRGLF